MSSTHARVLPLGGTPWTRGDAVAAAALIAFGCVVWAIGWFQVSGKAALEEQIAPMNVAVLGIVIVGVGQGSWFLRGRRAVGDRRRRLVGRDAVPSMPSVDATYDDLFAGAESLFHRLDCAMVADRAWSPTSRAAHEQAGRRACGVCTP